MQIKLNEWNPQLIPIMAAETRIATTKYHIFFARENRPDRSFDYFFSE